MSRASPLRTVLVLAGLVLACADPGPSYPRAPRLDEAVRWVQDHGQKPEDYVIGAFAAHRVVILGEFHRIRHDVLLVQRLVPRLYQAGVFTLAIEFACADDQDRIDRLVTAPEYDEALARDLQLHVLLSTGLGGYQEYADLFRAAWALNRSLPGGARPFRILGLNNDVDWSPARTRSDLQDPAITDRIWGGQTEGRWVERLKTQVLDRGGKALVYCGLHHAFTRFRQPVVDQGKFVRFVEGRFGNELARLLGDQVFMIALHAPWASSAGSEAPRVLPADGGVDQLLARLPDPLRSVAFDTAGTPMGDFTGQTSVYRFGAGTFRLADFCDGYLCQGLLADSEPVTAIPHLINASNLDEVRRRFPNPDLRQDTAEQLQAVLTDDATVLRRMAAGALEASRRMVQEAAAPRP